MREFIYKSWLGLSMLIAAIAIVFFSIEIRDAVSLVATGQRVEATVKGYEQVVFRGSSVTTRSGRSSFAASTHVMLVTIPLTELDVRDLEIVVPRFTEMPNIGEKTLVLLSTVDPSRARHASFFGIWGSSILYGIAAFIAVLFSIGVKKKGAAFVARAP